MLRRQLASLAVLALRTSAGGFKIPKVRRSFKLHEIMWDKGTRKWLRTGLSHTWLYHCNRNFYGKNIYFWKFPGGNKIPCASSKIGCHQTPYFNTLKKSIYNEITNAKSTGSENLLQTLVPLSVRYIRSNLYEKLYVPN